MDEETFLCGQCLHFKKVSVRVEVKGQKRPVCRTCIEKVARYKGPQKTQQKIKKDAAK